MAIEDGLDIAPGPGQGEAYIHPQSTFDPVRFSSNVFAVQMADQQRKRALEQQRHLKVNDFLSKLKNVKSKWDTDQINYFSPLFDKFRKKSVGLLKNNGTLTDLQMRDLMVEQNELDQDTELSNQQFDKYEKIYNKANEKLTSGSQAYNAKSRENVTIWGNPFDFTDAKITLKDGTETTVGAELKKHNNNPIKFREANKQLLNLSPSWYLDQQTQEAHGKLKPASGYRYGTSGPLKGIVESEDYTDAQIESVGRDLQAQNPDEFSRQLNETFLSHLEPQEFEKLQKNALKRAGVITQTGAINPKFQETIAAKVEADMTGKSQAEKDTYLQHLKAEIVDKSIETEAFREYWRRHYPGKKEFHPSGNDGSDKSFEDKWNVVAEDSPSVLTDYRAFNKEYGTNHTAESFKANMVNPKETGYVAIEPKKAGPDTESLQLELNGKPVRPIGYKIQDGRLFMTMVEFIPVQTDPFSPPKLEQRVSTNVPVNDYSAANIAAHYGFTSVAGFMNMLQNKIQKAGATTKGKIKVETKSQHKGIDLSQFDKTKK